MYLYTFIYLYRQIKDSVFIIYGNILEVRKANVLSLGLMYGSKSKRDQNKHQNMELTI